MNKLNFKNLKKNWISLVGITVIASILSLAFAWSAGLVGNRITTKTFLGNSLENFEPGYRRAHGKGICFEGTYYSNGRAAIVSKADVFSKSDVPAIGRFSIGNSNPHASDNSTSTVSMALLLTPNDQSQWRMKLNNFPYFSTRNPEGFLAQMSAFKPDPVTGQPDPELVAAFFKEYPEARKSVEDKAKMPLTGSFSGTEYYVVNAFILRAANGQKQPVRWSMRPHSEFISMTKEQHARSGHDFLFEDIKNRLAVGPLYWDLVLQLAESGDPVNDPSQPWPNDRKEIIAGTLEVKHVTDQINGACRDVNFDPTLVPPGIELSDDPVLAARAGIYSHSYNARLREIGFGKATDAVGK
ncbi:catalase [Acinetobacter sp. Root1280]|uniref:catalase family peroxidase n=1 Tax=Acinetobacter sp. Root1280 TaxID=1736444 RepID=UPI0006F58C93|nr:catalase family peroxidase [Acinetobacter sp. Root1280]KQW88290.1 catalase [Acinetobacter sp. Root1280]